MIHARSMAWAFALLLTLPAGAEEANDNVIPTPRLEPAVMFNPNDMLNPQDWKRLYFDVVVVVNRARKVQTIQVYRNGLLVKEARVTTGRDRPELADPTNPKAPIHSYFSQTPTGYFTADRLDIDHHSNEWSEKGADGEMEGSFMPWAVFFNGGIATHRSPLEYRDEKGLHADRNIGKPISAHVGSGACVRLHEQDAKDVFWWVRTSGGPYTPAELTRQHPANEPDFASEAEEVYQMQGLRPYPQNPSVPDVDQFTGNFIDRKTRRPFANHSRDAEGSYQVHYGPKALYIVMSVDQNGYQEIHGEDELNVEQPSQQPETVIRPPVNIGPRSTRQAPSPASGLTGIPGAIGNMFGTVFGR